jgi:tight adherence protein B
VKQALPILAAMALQLVLLWLAFSGSAGGGRSAKRLQAVKLRHATVAAERVETQLRKAAPSPLSGATPAKSARLRVEAALSARLHRAGHGLSLGRYLQATAAIGIVLAVFTLIETRSVTFAVVLGVVAAVLLPYALVSNLIGRQKRAFIAKFPEAVELLVYGLRSGLPVSETLGLVSTEVPGPVGHEFRLVTERMRIGRSMEDALHESAERLGIPEFNFFSITLAIHRETGGNLTETLVNLADVLRKRAQMTLKIRAMSSEARASALILGALPFLVFMLIWATNSSYLAGFFVDPRLMIAGLGGMVWMAIGGLVMARLVSFEI